MAAAIGVRSDYASADLRRFARRSRDPDQVRRLLAIALILDGGSRSDAEASPPQTNFGTLPRPTKYIHHVWNTCVAAAGLLFAAVSDEIMGASRLLMLFLLYALIGFGIHLMSIATLTARAQLRENS